MGKIQDFKNIAFLGTLFFLLVSSEPALAIESNVLVSREGERYTGSFLISREAYDTDAALISREDEDINRDGFVIRKEKYTVAGVLVSRPSEIDTTMFDMLNANNIRSLEDYSGWLRENVGYKRDEYGDNWAFPEETLDRKYGDCEDFAFFNASVLRVLGYHPTVLALGTFRILGGTIITSHAICVFKKGDYYLWFDNEKLKKTEASSMEEFARHIFTSYDYSSISELMFDGREWATLFTRSDVI